MTNRAPQTDAEYDSQATLARIRERHQCSISAYCREHGFEHRTFYSALQGVRGRVRKGSKAAKIINHLDEVGLLVRKQA